MRKNRPAYCHKFADASGIWSITRNKDIKAIYSNPKIFSSTKGVLLRSIHQGDDPGGNLTLALTDPPRHTQLRAIMSRWFSMGYLRSLEEMLRMKTRTFLSQAIQHKKCDFTNDISARLTMFITCYIFGIPEKDHDNIFHWVHESFDRGTSLASHRELMIYFCELLEEKKSHPKDDLASAIVNGIASGVPLTEKEILLNFDNVMGATENAGLSISTGILAFLKNPESWEMLSKNRNLLNSAIEEVLRWASSASHSMRTVMESSTINNIKFIAGLSLIHI